MQYANTLFACSMSTHSCLKHGAIHLASSAVSCHLPTLVCRDLYHDIAIPGGIAMKSFSEAWARFCQGMDYNDYSLLPSPAKQLLSAVSK